ncbi:MAG TPA: alpha/beta fold hydrolase [Planctomycetota bacterium]
MRGAVLAAVLLTGAQDVKEERGTYRLSCFGREAGEETWRLSEFDTGAIVLTSKVKFEVEVQGQKRGYDVDTSLTMSKGFAPARYAGYHKAGREEKLIKLEWEKGKILSDGQRPRPTKATHLLDNNTVAQLLPILRTPGAPKKVKVYRPAQAQDQDLLIEDRGEAMLAGPDASIRVRELKITAGYLDVIVHVDDRLRVLRAWHAQTEVLAELEGYAGWKPVPPPPPGAVEEELLFKNGEIALAGTVTRPKAPGKVHAVVILSASGPQDRHGHVTRGGDGLERFAWEAPEADLYRDIAGALKGFLVFRYDDRGCGKSGGTFTTARLAELEADAEAAIRAVKARGDVDRLLLVGHDEGGLLALRLAPRVGASGVITLASPAKTLDVVLLESAGRALKAQGTSDDLIVKILEKERATQERIRTSTDDTLEVDERRVFVGWMRDRFTLDPLKAGTPAAVFHGSRDEVVSAEHAAFWKAPSTKVLPGLDHVFRRAGGPVDPAFLKALADECVLLTK